MNILIVEDHPITSYAYHFILTNTLCNVKLFEAKNSKDAINIIKNEHINLAIIDIGLTNSNGFQIVKFIKENKYNIKIIIISLYDDLPIIWFCKKIGVDAFISKSTRVEKIVDVIKDIFSSNKFYVLNENTTHDLRNLFIEDFDFLYDNIKTLTHQERNTLKLKLKGFKNKEIASILNIKTKSVENYINRMKTKFVPENSNFQDFIEKNKNILFFILSFSE